MRWGAIVTGVGPRITAALRAFMTPASSSAERVLGYLPTVDDHQASMHQPDPDGWEPCPSLDHSGLCPMGVPMSGHIVGSDGNWWHVKRQPS